VRHVRESENGSITQLDVRDFEIFHHQLLDNGLGAVHGIDLALLFVSYFFGAMLSALIHLTVFTII